MKDKVKWGIIGSGGIAKRRTIPEGILPARNAQLAAVYDLNQSLNAQLAKQFNAKAVSSVEELLAEELDAVYVATPANVHCQQVIKCAQAKKHVFCEKPLGMTIDEAQKMIEECKKHEVKLGAAFMMRFHSQHQAAQKMIHEGRLGKPVYARAQLSCWYPPMAGAWRLDPKQSGGGSLIDMGGHCIDLLEMLLGQVKSVCCLTNNLVHDYRTEDSAVVMLRFANGAMATVDTFFCIPDDSSKNILEVYGSKGSIIAKNTIGQGQAGEMTAYLDNSDGSYNAQQGRTVESGLVISPKPVNTYQSEIEEFSAAILGNRPALNDAAAGLQSQKILSACYESAKLGKFTDV